MAGKIRFVININSGAVCFRTSATDENPIIFRKIDDETANAIVGKKINVNAVIDALMKVESSKEGFSWREYDKKRQAAEKLLNVSKRDMVPTEDDPNKEDESKADGDVVSLAELGLVSKDDKPAAKKAAKKVESAPAPSVAESVNY